MAFLRTVRTDFVDPVPRFWRFQLLEPDTRVPVHTLIMMMMKNALYAIIFTRLVHVASQLNNNIFPLIWLITMIRKIHLSIPILVDHTFQASFCSHVSAAGEFTKAIVAMKCGWGTFEGCVIHTTSE